jgi:transcriptional regulator with XRE-family HTH domain
MGREPRQQPQRLAEKLYDIRARLELSKTEMRDHLGLPKTYHHSFISLWECGKREPSLLVLLNYARSVSVPLDVLVDNELDLPAAEPRNQRLALQPSRLGIRDAKKFDREMGRRR